MGILQNYLKALRGSERIEKIEAAEGHKEGVEREQEYQSYLAIKITEFKERQFKREQNLKVKK